MGLIDSDAIGVEVSWSFGNGDAEAVTISRENVRVLLAERGFDPALVDELNEDQALRKAAHAVKGRSKELVIQELRRPNKDTPRAFGVYQVIGRDGETGDDLTMRARARCEAGRIRCLPPEGATGYEDERCRKVGEEIARIANSLLDNVVNRDISDLLTEIGWSELWWITRRRNSGGVYYVPAGQGAERFVELLHGLESVSKAMSDSPSRWFCPEVMEVYPKPLTMRLWSGAARNQYAAQVDKLMGELRAMRQDGKMGDRTMQARADECDRLMRAAEAHSEFLADAAAGIAAELAGIRDGFLAQIAENVAVGRSAFQAIAELTPTGRKRKATSASKPVEEGRQLDLDSMSIEELFTIK